MEQAKKSKHQFLAHSSRWSFAYLEHVGQELVVFIPLTCTLIKILFTNRYYVSTVKNAKRAGTKRYMKVKNQATSSDDLF